MLLFKRQRARKVIKTVRQPQSIKTAHNKKFSKEGVAEITNNLLQHTHKNKNGSKMDRKLQ